MGEIRDGSLKGTLRIGNLIIRDADPYKSLSLASTANQNDLWSSSSWVIMRECATSSRMGQSRCIDSRKLSSRVKNGANNGQLSRRPT